MLLPSLDSKYLNINLTHISHRVHGFVYTLNLFALVILACGQDFYFGVLL